MTSLFKPSRSVFIAGGVALALLLGTSAAHPAASPVPSDPARSAASTERETARRAAAAFEDWRQRNGAVAAVPAEAIEEGRALARERREALLRLAQSDPRQALASALPPSAIRRLPSPIREQVERYVDGTGSLDVLVEDDFDRPVPASRIRRTLTLDGRRYDVQVFGRRLGLPAKRIHANGVAIGTTLILYETPFRRLDAEEAAADPVVRALCRPASPCVAVKVGETTQVLPDEPALRRYQAALEREEDAVGPDHADAEAIAPASVWTEGEKLVLYMRVDFSDLPGDPVTTEAAQGTLDGAVNAYYQETSYAKTSIRATVTPLLRMPRTAAEYKTVGDGQLLTDARAAAQAAGFDGAAFNLDIVAFAKLFDGYSGKARVGRKGAWLNGSFGASVTAHELGHNYGVHHANFWRTTDGTTIGAGANEEYGNIYDVMGRGGTRGHLNAWFKSRLDWLTPADYTSVTESATLRIEPIDDPAAGGPRALRIRKDDTRNYWVEFRQKFTSNRWAMNGALLTWGYNSNTGSHLLDLTPGSANDRNDAPLLVGRTFSDVASGIHITPIARTSSPPAMDVVVKLGSFPDNTPPSAALAASALTVARNVPVTLTASASDPNGDALAYGWEFEDGVLAPNAASFARSWSTEGPKLVRCTVSDMVGGTTTVSTTVNVVTTFSISGSVTLNGQPLAGVVVSDGTRSATTGSTGGYSIAGVPNGTYVLTPMHASYTFSPASLAVTVAGANLSGRSFTASPANRILDAHFDTGADGFSYQDDAFRGTAQPAYASGAQATSGGVSGGALSVRLGGVDDRTVLNMSGGWGATFSLPEAQSVALSFSYRLTQSAEYESDERSELLAAVDGNLLGPAGVVAQVVGNGNGGSPRSSGLRGFMVNLGTLPAGSHTLLLGAFNNKKTLANETTEAVIDEVVVFRP